MLASQRSYGDQRRAVATFNTVPGSNSLSAHSTDDANYYFQYEDYDEEEG